MKDNPFKTYLRESEPSKYHKSSAWQTAIGLQAVDGLSTSHYLHETAIRHIEGQITMDEVNDLIHHYYEATSSKETANRVEEADKVSARIAALLSEQSFSFTPSEYIAIHRKLFTGLYSHAGQVRDYNISKKEWVLNGATVLYGTATELESTLNYDLTQERAFSYKNLSMDETIKHLALFVARLWQIHLFEEGNTRTTAVFFIKYLRSLGFELGNDSFAKHSWYFRNALVRANYNDLKNRVFETTEYLELFLRNVLLDEKNQLDNRDLKIELA